MESIGPALAYALSAFGAAIGVGMIGSAALNAAGRNPEKIKEYQTLMVMAIAFTDALAIIGFVVSFIV
jgi:F-type H+-transporting ATPase subunit c